jgi:hypothetical protein
MDIDESKSGALRIIFSIMFCHKLDERRSPALALASAKSASAPIFGAQSASASAAF